MTFSRLPLLSLRMALLGLGLFGATNAFAYSELRELYRGTRAQAMGNAFVAVADDDEAIFYNPAGLAGIKGFSLNYAVADLELSTDAIATATTGTSALSNFSPSSLNALMGKDIYARAQITPNIVMPKFGIALIVDEQVAILAKNQALPQLTIGYQTTDGVQVATGTSVLKRGRSDLRVGAAMKLLWRRGGYHILPATALFSLGGNTLGDLSGDFEQGIGADVGLQYIYTLNKKLSFAYGFSATDMGDTTFGGQADPLKSNFSMGLAATFKMPNLTAILAYDQRHLLTDTDGRKRNHIGLELQLPFISVMGGMNQMYLTYGASFDLWIFKLTAVSYAEELDTYAFQDPERRYLLRIALKFGL